MHEMRNDDVVISSFLHTELLNQNHIVKATVLVGNLMKKNLVK